MEQNNHINTFKEGEELFLQRFSQIIRENFDAFLLEKGFNFKSQILDKYFFMRVYRKNNEYIEIAANMHPMDFPYSWNILLGEGASGMPEGDWNKVALWCLMRRLGNPLAKEFSLSDAGVDKLNEDVKSAKNDLERFGNLFLDGDLKLFHEVRSSVNQNREPYKKSIVEDDGSLSMVEDENSKKLRDKYI